MVLNRLGIWLWQMVEVLMQHACHFFYIVQGSLSEAGHTLSVAPRHNFSTIAKLHRLCPVFILNTAVINFVLYYVLTYVCICVYT